MHTALRWLKCKSTLEPEIDFTLENHSQILEVKKLFQLAVNVYIIINV